MIISTIVGDYYDKITLQNIGNTRRCSIRFWGRFFDGVLCLCSGDHQVQVEMVRASNNLTSTEEGVKTPHRIELCDDPPARPIRAARTYRKRRIISASAPKTENKELKSEAPSQSKITRSKPLKTSNGISNMTNGLSLRSRGARASARATESHKLTEYFKEEIKSPKSTEYFNEEIKSTKSTDYFKEEIKAEPPASPPLEKTVKVENKVTNGNSNHKLTEYFPVRRSVRKTSKCVMAEKMRDLERAVREQKEDGLQVKYFEGKGRGVVATRAFHRGQFVVEYSGELVGMGEAREREARYAADPSAGCYMYYFRLQDQQYCIDATAESGRLGRLVNHSRNGNLHTKALWVDGPRLVLLAGQDISPGEELTYDYGDRSKESLLHHPWLAL